VTDDTRDEQIGEALAVPPLDDLTRRRLVRNALAASVEEPDIDDTGADDAAERRSWGPLVAAAVVILLVVGGFVALGRSGDDNPTDTAARKADRTPTAETPTGQAPSAAADSASGAAASFAAGTALYGDLGDLSTTAARTAARSAIGAPDAPSGEVSESFAARVATASCAAPLRAAGTVVGIGSATVDGRRAGVVVTQSADGTRTPYLLEFSPCTVSPL
jgi:hypothetical protein